MNVFDLYAMLSLDSSNYEKGLNDAESKGSKFGSGLKKAGGIAAGAITAASGAVVGFAKESVEAGMNFDSSMSQVAATMGTTVDQIGDLRAFAQKMGSETAFSASQAADALNYMALAGYDADKSMGMLPTVLNLAASGGMDLASASDMVTDASSALGLTTEETAAMVDQMAQASSKSNTSVAQLGEAMLGIGATGKLLSGGTTELSTALGILADNGIKGAEGGTKLRNMLLALANPTKSGYEALEKLGVEAYDASGQLRPLEDIMGDLNGAMDGFSDAQRTQVIGQIFNKADIAAANAMLNTSKERWEELGTAIDNSTGAAEQMAGTQLDNLQGDITLFQSALEGAQIAISDKLTPDLREFVQFGADGISRLTTAFQEGGLSGAMGELGSILSDAVSMIVSKLPEIVDAGTQLLGALVKGILDNAPTILGAAKDITLMIAKKLAEAAPQIIPTITSLTILITQTLTEPSFMTQLLQAALAIMQGLQSGLLEAIPMLIQSLPVIIDNICTFLIDAIPLILQAGTDMFNGIIEALPIIMDALGEALPMIVESICQLLINGLPLILQGAITMFQAIINAIPIIVTALVKKLPDIINSIVDVLISNTPMILSAAIDLFMALLGAIPVLILELGKQIPTIISSIVENLLKGIGQIFNVGGKLLEGLWNGMSDKVGWLMDKIKGFGGTILGGIKDVFSVHSPSKETEQIGQFLAEGLGVGFDDEIDNVSKDLQKSAGNMLNDLSDAMSLDAVSIGANMDANTIRATGGINSSAVSDDMIKVIDAIMKKMEFTIDNNVYIGQKKIEQQVATATAHRNTIAGGR